MRRLTRLQLETSGELGRLGASEAVVQYVRELLARQHEQYRHNLSLEDQKLYRVQTQLKSVEVRPHSARAGLGLAVQWQAAL